MGLSSESIPNNALTGPELKIFALSLLEKALNAEWVFNQGTSYPRVGLEITAKFHFQSPSLPKTEVRVRPQPPVEPAPLKDLNGADSGVIAVHIEKTVENPNLERVHAGIPIQVTSKIGAAPGQMFPKIETHAVVYDKTDYPEPEPPKQTDISKQTAAEWNIKLADLPREPVRDIDPKDLLAPVVSPAPERVRVVRVGPVTEAPYVPLKHRPLEPEVPSTYEDELDAISTEEE